MNNHAQGRAFHHFPGVTVIVPVQTHQESEIVPIDLRDQTPDDIPNETINFKVIRYIANIVLFRKEDLEREIFERPIQNFDPPIEFRVAYNEIDELKVRGAIHNLKLAYWDGEKWVIISDPSHDFQILPPGTAKVAEAKIRSWIGDPPLAWGR